MPAGQMAEMAWRLPDARHVVLSGGHLVHRDASDAYRATVTDWLAHTVRGSHILPAVCAGPRRCV